MNKLIQTEIIHPQYPEGAICIKENNFTLTPVAIIPFPAPFHQGGVQRQKNYGKLFVHSPENFERMKDLSSVVNQIVAECAKAIVPDGTPANEALSNIIGLIDNSAVSRLLQETTALIEEVEK